MSTLSRRLTVDRRAALLALLLGLAVVPTLRAQNAAAFEADTVAKLQAARDEADTVLLLQLAKLKTPTAAKSLVDFYGAVASIWMKREVLKVMSEFDGVAGAAPIAIDHVATIAANASEPELRDAAFEALEKCKQLGPTYLAKIVELPIQDQVRERALEAHAKSGTDAADWYKKLYSNEKLPKKLREKAFAALVTTMKDGELIKAFKDLHDGALRRIALEALAAKDGAGVADLALDTLKQVTALGTDRAAAAKVLADKKGAKAANDLIEIGTTQATTPEVLREAIADLLGGLHDEALDKRLAGMVGKGKPHEQRFALLASKHLLAADDKLRKKVRAQLDDKDTELRRVAIRVLGEARDVEAIPELEKLLAKPKDPGDATVVVMALTALKGPDDKWQNKLVAMAGGNDRDLRNAALQVLGDAGGAGETKLLSLFRKAVAHEDWATRLIALHALEKLRDRDSIGAIVTQMQKESGRTLIEFAATLFRLTGELHENDSATWLKWWEGMGKETPLISEADLKKRSEERERKRLKQTTLARFFGVKIESHNVLFVVDTSGSMSEQLESSVIDGHPATRNDIVRQEIVKALKSLDGAAFFNLITFASSVTPWKEGVVALTDKTRAEAIDYAEHLGSKGGTNIYDALEAAFQDPKVDTLFLLTDGEPSAGAVTDLQFIREHVARWNATRHIKINCIGVGGDFSLLEWLAQDSGGSYVKYN